MSEDEVKSAADIAMERAASGETLHEEPEESEDTTEKEIAIIEEVMQKNMDLVDKTVIEKSLNWEDPRSAVKEVHMDFPSVPHQVVTDEQAINDILAKFEGEMTPKMKGRGKKLS